MCIDQHVVRAPEDDVLLRCITYLHNFVYEKPCGPISVLPRALNPLYDTKGLTPYSIASSFDLILFDSCV